MEEASTIASLLARLAAIPEHVARASAGKNESDLSTPPVSGGWSLAEIFAHMRAADDIIAQRAFAIAVRDRVPLAAFDERRWGEVAGYVQADFQDALALFTLRRIALVSLLRRLTPADWQHTGIHEERGPLSLLTVVTTLVEHDEEHVAQLAATHIR